MTIGAFDRSGGFSVTQNGTLSTGWTALAGTHHYILFYAGGSANGTAAIGYINDAGRFVSTQTGLALGGLSFVVPTRR